MGNTQLPDAAEERPGLGLHQNVSGPGEPIPPTPALPEWDAADRDPFDDLNEEALDFAMTSGEGPPLVVPEMLHNIPTDQTTRAREGRDNVLNSTSKLTRARKEFENLVIRSLQ
eukprot:7511049-Pyramimonas_sp.AAC.1